MTAGLAGVAVMVLVGLLATAGVPTGTVAAPVGAPPRPVDAVPGVRVLTPGLAVVTPGTDALVLGLDESGAGFAVDKLAIAPPGVMVLTAERCGVVADWGAETGGGVAGAELGVMVLTRGRGEMDATVPVPLPVEGPGDWGCPLGLRVITAGVAAGFVAVVPPDCGELGVIVRRGPAEVSTQEGRFCWSREEPAVAAVRLYVREW